MKELFQKAKQQLEDGLDCVLVTVTESFGSAPRGAGSRMLVLADGTSTGTIGGGNIEYTASRLALELFRTKRSFSEKYLLRQNDAADLGMVCGGNVTVYYQYLSPENYEFLRLCTALLDVWDVNQKLWMVWDITDEQNWNACFCGDRTGVCGGELSDYEASALLHRKPQIVEHCGHRYYSEPLLLAGTVYIFGGGHVARELVPLLAHLDFRCIVFDDRTEFANAMRFPDAYACIEGDFERLNESIQVTADDYVCIMTRGHLSDYAVQRQMLRTPAAYIGVMGSRRKTLELHRRLRADGFTDSDITRCKSPIGIEISSETPAEIAVSIAAELIQARAARQQLPNF